MKIVHRVSPRCDCQAKLKQLELEEAHGDGMEIGSIVECDCGKLYRLAEHQFDGRFWQWHHPDSGNMALR